MKLGEITVRDVMIDYKPILPNSGFRDIFITASTGDDAIIQTGRKAA